MQTDKGLLLDSVLALRAAIGATREPETRASLRETESRLRRALGPSIPKGQAARVLGTSTAALERWVQRGVLPVVVRPGTTRIELETAPVLALAERASALREQGRSRPIRLAIQSLRWPEHSDGRQVLSIDVASLPRPNVSAAELRSGFRDTTPESRVREAAAVSGALAALAAHEARSPGVVA